MRVFLAVIVALVITGCANVQYSRSPDGSQQKLNPSASVYVMIPVNPSSSAGECKGVGKIVANLVYASFYKHAKRVELASDSERLEDGLKKAKDLGFTYLVNMKIFTWEDHVTEWNGMVDQIDMQMETIDIQSGNILDSVNFKGHGTFFTLGGYHPQNIVAKQIPDYVALLFL